MFRIQLRSLVSFAILLLGADFTALRADDLYVATSDRNLPGLVFQVGVAGKSATFASGVPAYACGMAADARDNLYITDYYGGTIVKVTPAGVVSYFVSGLDHPTRLAFNRHGDLFVTSFNSGQILKVTSTGFASTYSSGLHSPNGLAFDSTDNLYVAQFDGIYKVAGNGGTMAFASGSFNPAGLAFDSTDKLYVASQNNNLVMVFTKSGVGQTFAAGINSPADLAFDSRGILHVSSPTTDSVFKVSTTVIVTLLANGLHKPTGLVFRKLAPEPVVTLPNNVPGYMVLMLVMPAAALVLALAVWLVFGRKRKEEFEPPAP